MGGRRTPGMVMVTVAVETSPSASVILYVNVSCPVYPLPWVYVKVPSALTTAVPWAAWLTSAHTLPPSALSVSFTVRLPDTAVSTAVV